MCVGWLLLAIYTINFFSVSSALQDCESAGKVVPATKPPPLSNDTAPEPVTELPSHDQSEDSDDMPVDDNDMSIGDSPESGKQSRKFNVIQFN